MEQQAQSISECLSKWQITKDKWQMGVSSLYDVTSAPLRIKISRTHWTQDLQICSLVFHFLRQARRTPLLNLTTTTAVGTITPWRHAVTLYSLLPFTICDLLYMPLGNHSEIDHTCLLLLAGESPMLKLSSVQTFSSARCRTSVMVWWCTPRW